MSFGWSEHIAEIVIVCSRESVVSSDTTRGSMRPARRSAMPSASNVTRRLCSSSSVSADGVDAVTAHAVVGRVDARGPRRGVLAGGGVVEPAAATLAGPGVLDLAAATLAGRGGVQPPTAAVPARRGERVVGGAERDRLDRGGHHDAGEAGAGLAQLERLRAGRRRPSPARRPGP